MRPPDDKRKGVAWRTRPSLARKRLQGQLEEQGDQWQPTELGRGDLLVAMRAVAYESMPKRVRFGPEWFFRGKAAPTMYFSV